MVEAFIPSYHRVVCCTWAAPGPYDKEQATDLSLLLDCQLQNNVLHSLERCTKAKGFLW